MRDLDFTSGTVEPEGLKLLSDLMRIAKRFSGNIIEIGTLFGKTAIHFALLKAAHQRVITVDRYSWNPWRLSKESHFQLTSEILYYPVFKGDIVQIELEADDFYADWCDMPPPALFFYDADHREPAVTKAIQFASRVNARIICGHDYSPDCPGTVKAVDKAGGPKEVRGRVWVL